ncbi:MAG TPA: LD-carboxypeptidase [Streptosporangiaceae bacterium]|jgi:muramoyltetrapeptide carboxypeptidase|nr:LD-carboxypeptidase [Streptosporangiaceae bacterium]
MSSRWAAEQRPASLRRPPALVPGDRVAVLTISSPVNQDALPAGLDALRFAGLEPVVYPSAHDAGSFRQYLASDDAQRASDLGAALSDPSIAGILFACGGYGAQRTIEAIRWDSLTSLEPKVLAGYSDVTAILEAVAAKLGWSSLLSTMVATSGVRPHYSFGSMLRTLMRPEQAMSICYPDALPIRGGRARGMTLGGNLALLASSIGTDSCLPAKGGILLIEDVDEEDYRLDRMLTQLRRSGYLEGVAGVLTGTFADCGEQSAIEEILAERLGDLEVPVLARANVGHGCPFQAFPIGVAAELDADAGTLTLLDPPLQPRSTDAAAINDAAGPVLSR